MSQAFKGRYELRSAAPRRITNSARLARRTVFRASDHIDNRSCIDWSERRHHLSGAIT